MAEAIISRSSGGTQDGGISNETKLSLGLPNNATIDDVIEMLSLKDENYGTIVVSLLNPDNTPIVGSTIQMVDAGGGILNYTSNNQGKCLFKTQAGQATFNDYSYPGYIDLIRPSNITVDCPVGSVSSIKLQRTIRGNGYKVQITSNQNVKFSNFIDSVNVHLSGGGGGSARPHGRCNTIFYANMMYRTMSFVINNNIYGGPGGNAYDNYSIINPTADTNYQVNIGAGGYANSLGLSSASNYRLGSAGSQLWVNDLGTNRFSITESNMNSWFFQNGSSGGTSRFGSILSAIGGAGGAWNSLTKPSGGTGSLGGANGILSMTFFGIKNCDGTLRATNGYTAWSNQYPGTTGFCWINDFKYKSF